MRKHGGAWVGLVAVLACGPAGGDGDGDGDSTGGPGSSGGEETFGDADGSTSSSSSAGDDADVDGEGEGPICVVGDPGAIAFCDIAHGCDSDEECADGMVCNFDGGYCEPSSSCTANADCSGSPCHDGWCVHTPCAADDRCGGDAICFAGWCTMVDTVAPCEGEPAWIETSLALPDGPPITAIADIALQWGTGIAVARGDEVITTVNVEGAELVLEAGVLAPPLAVTALASHDLIAGLSGAPGPDLLAGGPELAVLAAGPTGFESPTVLTQGLVATLAVSAGGDLPYAAALVDDAGERTAMLFDATFGTVDLVAASAVTADAIDIDVHADGDEVLVVGPASITVLAALNGALDPATPVELAAEHPAIAGAWAPDGDDVRAVVLGGATPLLVVFDDAGPDLVLALAGAPHALVAEPADDGAAPALVVATDAVLERVLRADGAPTCAAPLATSIVPLHLTPAHGPPEGFTGLMIASDTSVAFLRPQ